MDELLYQDLTGDQIQAYCLVLDAYHMAYRTDANEGGGRIWVERENYPRARELVEAYILENPPSEKAEISSLPGQKTFSALWICMVLAAVHWIIHTAPDQEQIIAAYGASAADILQGQVYRAVTALMIHADLSHLVGNLAGIALLGTWVAAITGPGVGWLCILLTGILGNLANAAFYQVHHLSIGASTAVFGALGLLAAFQFQFKQLSPRPFERRRAWLALAGAMALLGFMGTAARADLLAHLFGILSGIGLGLVLVRWGMKRIQDKHQVFCMAAVVAITALAWTGPIGFD